jgi:uncharacterized protein (TIGR02147 family)
MKSENPEIFQYIDFRKYLEDYYSVRKSLDASFTHEYICRRLGQENAKSYFNNVVKGRANVTPAFTDRFIDLLELKPDEAKYFRALVNYNQTISPHEKEFFFDQLVRLNSTPHRVIDRNAYAFYKEWRHSAIRALLDIVNISNKTLARLPSASRQKIAVPPDSCPLQCTIQSLREYVISIHQAIWRRMTTVQ